MPGKNKAVITVQSDHPVFKRHVIRLRAMHYEVTGFIGAGAEGKVLFADNLMNGMKCAVKVSHMDQGPRNTLGERLFWSYIRHPNCMRLLEKFVIKHYGYYVMHYTQNLTLYDWIGGIHIRPLLNDRVLPPGNEATYRKWSGQLVLGMDYLHQHGLFHLDLKPNNVFLEDDWRIVVGDFGFLRSRYDKTLPVHVGCPAYMPPEALVAPVTLNTDFEKVDIWTIGSTLYEMMTGKMMSEPTGFFMRREKMIANVKRNLSSMRSNRKKCLGGTDLVLSMMEWNAVDRPSTCEVLRHPWLKMRGVTGSKHQALNEAGDPTLASVHDKLVHYFETTVNGQIDHGELNPTSTPNQPDTTPNTSCSESDDDN